MDRMRELGGGDLRQQRKCHADEALHVASTAAEQLVAANFGLERIARPLLAVDRHDIGMARQYGTAFTVGSERREEVRLLAAGVHGPAAARTGVVQQLLRKIDQGQIGAATGGVERDETANEIDGRHGVSRSTTKWDGRSPRGTRRA